jgi:hypothetical protein
MGMRRESYVDSKVERRILTGLSPSTRIRGFKRGLLPVFFAAVARKEDQPDNQSYGNDRSYYQDSSRTHNDLLLARLIGELVFA